jgi:hypothetical protein
MARPLRLAVLTALLSACAGPGATARRAPPLPDAEAALAGCAGGQVDRVTWRVHCGGLLAELHDPYGEPSAALLALAAMRLGLAGGRVESRPAELAAAGTWVAGARLRVLAPGPGGAAGPERLAGVAVTIPFGEARTRLAWCAARASPGAARCEAVVNALASLPWRAGWTRGRLPPDLAGRPLVIPVGCEAQADPHGGDLSCSASDGWRWRRLGLLREVAPSDLEYAESAAEAARQAPATEPVPEAPADGRPCLVDGVATRCVVKEAWGGASVTVSTVATVRGVPLELACTFFGSPDELPAVCDGLEWGP